MMDNVVTVNRNTMRSIYAEILSYNGAKIASATAFLLLNTEGRMHLITNRHVVTGIHQDTGEPLSHFGGIPFALRCAIKMNSVASPNFAAWLPVVIPLQDELWRNSWMEHPTMGSAIDVVAIPLSLNLLRSTTFVPKGKELSFHWMPLIGDEVAQSDIDLVPNKPPIVPDKLLELNNLHDIYENSGVSLQPTSEVQIIGFPIGFNPFDPKFLPFAIWCRGSIASEPEIDWGSRPRLLVDSRTRQGQSGSPVVAFTTHPYRDEAGNVQLPTGLHGGRLAGVYSGRMHQDSDLGFAWKPSAVREILDQGQGVPAPTAGPKAGGGSAAKPPSPGPSGPA